MNFRKATLSILEHVQKVEKAEITDNSQTVKRLQNKGHIH